MEFNSWKLRTNKNTGVQIQKIVKLSGGWTMILSWLLVKLSRLIFKKMLTWGEEKLIWNHTFGGLREHSLRLDNTTHLRACPDKSLSSEYQQAISFFGQNRDSSSKVGIPNTDLTIAVILPWLASKDRVRELWWNSVNKYHLCRCKDVYLRPLKVYQPQCQSN